MPSIFEGIFFAMKFQKAKELLDRTLEESIDESFIEDDPISIPHRFTQKQDIEIAAFFAAIFSWGRRATIINKTSKLMEMMENQPFGFVKGLDASGLSRFEDFKHRTFNGTDILFFIQILHDHYKNHESLETLFFKDLGVNVEQALSVAHEFMFSKSYAPRRTMKHFGSPKKGSACKRLNMFLRWMIRADEIDFGLWKSIDPSELMIPLDVHVARVARDLGILKRKQNDWRAVVELTSVLQGFDEQDPVKYDYALFILGEQNRKLHL